VSIIEDVELLRRIPMFAKVEPAKLKLLAFTSQRMTFETGQELFHQGDAADAAYIIVDGLADVIVDTPGGPLTVAQLGKNDLVGEIAIICEVPRTATVKAASRVTTLRIAKDLFFRMLTDFPVMALEVMRDLGHKLELANAKLRDAQAHTGT
jgi:CRP/FNR family transcriptional regulator, cyclic AMP receptor protein